MAPLLALVHMLGLLSSAAASPTTTASPDHHRVPERRRVYSEEAVGDADELSLVPIDAQWTLDHQQATTSKVASVSTEEDECEWTTVSTTTTVMVTVTPSPESSHSSSSSSASLTPFSSWLQWSTPSLSSSSSAVLLNSSSTTAAASSGDATSNPSSTAASSASTSTSRPSIISSSSSRQFLRPSHPSPPPPPPSTLHTITDNLMRLCTTTYTYHAPSHAPRANNTATVYTSTAHANSTLDCGTCENLAISTIYPGGGGGEDSPWFTTYVVAEVPTWEVAFRCATSDGGGKGSSARVPSFTTVPTPTTTLTMTF